MLALVLLPGMDGTGQLFEPFVAALGEEFSVQVVRYPATEPLGYAELASLVRAALPTDRPFVLLGESFSGPIAISVAASAPPQLKEVWCCVVRLLVIHSRFSVVCAGLFPCCRWQLRQRDCSIGSCLDGSRRRSCAPPSRGLWRRCRRMHCERDSDQCSGSTFLRSCAPSMCPCSTCEPPATGLFLVQLSRHIVRLKPDTHLAQIEASHFLLQASPGEAARVIGDFVRVMASDPPTREG